MLDKLVFEKYNVFIDKLGGEPMDSNEKRTDTRNFAQMIEKLPPKVRERISYIAEGALLAQEAAESQDNDKAS